MLHEANAADASAARSQPRKWWATKSGRMLARRNVAMIASFLLTVFALVTYRFTLFIVGLGACIAALIWTGILIFGSIPEDHDT